MNLVVHASNGDFKVENLNSRLLSHELIQRAKLTKRSISYEVDIQQDIGGIHSLSFSHSPGLYFKIYKVKII